MKITITSLCSRIVRITRQWWRRRNRWAQLWSKYTPRTGTIRTTEVFNYLLFINGQGKNARINNIHALLAGTITYSFVTAPGEKLKFEINNRTGLIRTTQVLDRDEPAREKEAYLTVLATDNGRPQLDDVCTFKVTIEDVNDNSPVFDKVVRAYLV